MPFIILWIIQLLAFFAIVSSIATFFTKFTKNASRNQDQNNPGDMEVPYEQTEAARRNVRSESRKSNRPERTKREQRVERRPVDRRQKRSEPIIKDVTTIDDPYNRKKKKASTSFSKKKLKQAVVYKEILDKPVSLRKK